MHLKLALEYEAMECIYRFRWLTKLENREYGEKLSFYLAHALGKIEKSGQSGEAYITEIAGVIKRVTDKYFPCQDLEDFSSRKTWITNRTKTQIRDNTSKLQKRQRNEIKMEIKLTKRSDIQKKID